MLLSSSNAFACECVDVFNNSFLGNTKRFEFIVKGKIGKNDMDFLTLRIEEIYKGKIKEATIHLGYAFGCDNLLTFEPGDQIIIGLEKIDSGSYPDFFVAPGCITSAVIIEGQKAFVPEYQLPMFKKPKIELFRRKMNLEAFEKKIKRRAGS